MKKHIMLITSIAMLLAVASCAPVLERPPAGVARQPIIPPVDPTLIQERLDKITKALERRDLSSTERTVLYSLQEAYQVMNNPPPNMAEQQFYRRSIQKLFYGLNSLEDLYLSRRPQLGAQAKTAVGIFNRKTKEILDAYLAGYYKEVIDQCIELKRDFGLDALTPELGVVFALSLAHKGMIKEAIAIGEQMANKLQTRPDLAALRVHLVQWHLKIGDRDGALRNYEKLQDLVDEREMSKKRLASLLGPLPSKSEKIPIHALKAPPGPEKGPALTNEGAIVPLDQFLAQIQGLIRDRKFDKARDLINRRRHQSTSSQELDRLAKALKEVDTKEDQFLQQRISVLSEQSEVLREAEALIEKERYDEALSKLALLNPESVDRVELTRLKDAAISGIINRDRNKAARLFLAAKRCEDPEKKERYLKSCLEILKALVERFPTSPLIYKVKDHIQRVTEELNKLS